MKIRYVLFVCSNVNNFQRSILWHRMGMKCEDIKYHKQENVYEYTGYIHKGEAIYECMQYKTHYVGEANTNVSFGGFVMLQ